MKKTIILIFFILFILQNIISQEFNAYLSYSKFYSPEKGPYIETYISIIGNSIKYKQLENKKYQGTLEISMKFSKGDTIADFAKYELKSPVIEDTSNIDISFIDQQRFLLPDGDYNFGISISDKYSNKKPFVYTVPINISFPENQIEISGIELIESYTRSDKDNILNKSGYDLIPYVSNFYPENIDNITFYTEIYNTSKVLGEEGKFLLKYYIESFETGKIINKYQKIKRENATLVLPVLSKFNIERLPSGNYKLIMEVRDKENELITQNSLFFQRSNPNIQFDINDLAAINTENTFVSKFNNEDTLREMIETFRPIASQIEKQFLNKNIEDADLQTMKRFFLNFWRARNNIDPQSEWDKYFEEVKKVNESYSTQVKHGYETDRGRVYLKYGPPNIITESYNEPSAYPYEIWHYYKLGDNQRNKKFVFYTYNLVTNDFVLLHSNALGELSNYRWQVELHRRDYDPQSVDDTKPPDAWGNKADDYYNIPR